MKIIQKLSDMIDDEITDAWKYAKCYQNYKEDEPELARTFQQLANEELNHMERLHAQVVRMIKVQKEKTGDPPEWMLKVYEYLHERSVGRAAEVKALLV